MPTQRLVDPYVLHFLVVLLELEEHRRDSLTSYLADVPTSLQVRFYIVYYFACKLAIWCYRNKIATRDGNGLLASAFSPPPSKLHAI